METNIQKDNFLSLSLDYIDRNWENIQDHLQIIANSKRDILRRKGYFNYDFSKYNNFVEFSKIPNIIDILYFMSYNIPYDKMFYMVTAAITIINSGCPVISYDVSDIEQNDDDIIAGELASPETVERFKSLGLPSTAGVIGMVLEDFLTETVPRSAVFMTNIIDFYFCVHVDHKRNHIVYFEYNLTDGDLMCRAFSPSNDAMKIADIGIPIMNSLGQAYRTYLDFKNSPSVVKQIDVDVSNIRNTPAATTTTQKPKSSVPKVIIRYVNMKEPVVRAKYVWKGGHHARPVEHIRHYKSRVLKDGTVRPAFDIVVNKGVTSENRNVTVYHE